MKLLWRWRDLGARVGLGGALWDSWGALLWELYGAEGRHYHSRGHLCDVLARLDQHRERFADPITAEIALWFHDAIYAVPSQRNEDASAALCAAFLTSVGGKRFRRAMPMIAATTHDGSQARDPDTALVLDIDLAGFADPWARFSENNARIRKEFAIYEESAYRAGRVAFLARLLTRGPLFRVLTDLETKARENIERHIVELSPPPSTASRGSAAGESERPIDTPGQQPQRGLPHDDDS